MYLGGITVGLGTFLIIGSLHPVVIKTEYHFGTKAWPAFLVSGVVCVCLSFFLNAPILSALFSVLGFSLLWSIRELFEQKQRVEKGWFPKNQTRDLPKGVASKRSDYPTG